MLEMFKCTYEESIEKVMAMEKSMEEREGQLSSLKSECEKYELGDLEVVDKLGEGQFGTVFLVTDPSQKKKFALKCVSKEQTIKNKL